MPTTTTLEQQRAQYAWNSVQRCSPGYTKLAKSAPALIMNNGLMQALAYYQGKGKNENREHCALLKHIGGWLKNQRLVKESDFPSLMTELHGTTSSDYRRVTEETLALLKWIRHLAPTVNEE